MIKDRRRCAVMKNEKVVCSEAPMYRMYWKIALNAPRRSRVYARVELIRKPNVRVVTQVVDARLSERYLASTNGSSERH